MTRRDTGTSGATEPEKLASPLPKAPSGYSRLDFSGIHAPRLTHYLFRFPAKFHPPVVHALLRSYTTPGQTILDPFCGSGTLLVAAAADGRHAMGSDVDPVSVFIAKAKTHRLQPGRLRASWASLRPLLEAAARSSSEYEDRRFIDISPTEYEKTLSSESLWTPQIPNLMHWFRRYVILDLARILHCINVVNIPETHRMFFRLIYASIIRNASNADPVPVSGLEVTSHMRKLDAVGRTINPFQLFQKAAVKGLAAAQAYWETSSPGSRVSVHCTDARTVTRKLKGQVDAVITSPPYHNAVDYYRRHKLEMFWLGFTDSQAERLALLPQYIGRPRIRKDDSTLQRLEDLGPLSSMWYRKMKNSSKERASAFSHYVLSMEDVFKELGDAIAKDGKAIFVLGNSTWNGAQIPTSDLFVEIAGDAFRLTDKLWYPVKNRYMSYGRHNGSGITEERVLVFAKTGER